MKPSLCPRCQTALEVETYTALADCPVCNANFYPAPPLDIPPRKVPDIAASFFEYAPGQGSHVCTLCKSRGNPISRGGEAIWYGLTFLFSGALVFLFMSGLFGFLLALFGFGIALYSAVNHKKVCRVCESTLIVPADSPAGKEILERHSPKKE